MCVQSEPVMKHLICRLTCVCVCVVIQTTLIHVPMARSSNDGYTFTSPGTPFAGHDSMGAANSISRGVCWCAEHVGGSKRLSTTPSPPPSPCTWPQTHKAHSSATSHVCLIALSKKQSGVSRLQSLTLPFFFRFFYFCQTDKTVDDGRWHPNHHQAAVSHPRVH